MLTDGDWIPIGVDNQRVLPIRLKLPLLLHQPKEPDSRLRQEPDY